MFIDIVVGVLILSVVVGLIWAFLWMVEDADFM